MSDEKVMSDEQVPWYLHHELARRAELCRNAGKGRTCFRPDASYGSEAYNDYEGEHDGIFHCSWTVLILQESLQIHR
jgi:hypothetical protein